MPSCSHQQRSESRRSVFGVFLATPQLTPSAAREEASKLRHGIGGPEWLLGAFEVWQVTDQRVAPLDFSAPCVWGYGTVSEGHEGQI